MQTLATAAAREADKSGKERNHEAEGIIGSTEKLELFR